MSQKNQVESIIPKSRIYIKIGEIPPKQQKIILNLIKEIGFSPIEIKELVIRISDMEEE